MERYFKFSELSKLEQQMYYNYIYLFLSSLDVVYILRLDIVQKPVSHACMYLEAVLYGEQE